MHIRKLRIRLLRLSFIPILLVAIFVRPKWSLESNAGFIMELGGYFFLLAGLTVRIWCIFYIGGRKSKRLITDGPYSICRNPLYIGTFLLAIGAGLCFENLLMLLLILLIFMPTHLLVARMEEDHLEKIFGDEYLSYKQKVPMFLPRFSNYTSSKVLQVPAHAMRRIGIDTAGVLLVHEIEDFFQLLH
jgi:protein-S-isoprenylcysteine O-methyltransferase Ste14